MFSRISGRRRTWRLILPTIVVSREHAARRLSPGCRRYSRWSQIAAAAHAIRRSPAECAACRRADRRRGLCRPGAGDRAAPGRWGRRSRSRSPIRRWRALRSDPRASAIVAAARRLFETIGVWDKVEAQPILDMVVTDSRLQDAVRPIFLTFDGEVEPGEPFAHMIENGAAAGGAGGRRRGKKASCCCRPRSPISIAHDPHPILPLSGREDPRRGLASIDVELADGSTISRAAAGRRRRRAFGDPRARRHRQPRLDLRPVRASSPPSRTSAITTVAPRSISCRPGRSRSCR